ncbi:MAG: PTS sugar transporter subunit IIB [Erysipelotrichaceae bacterium]|nr:PTS sugar transporter subunit IIB [Erysipelotrichaceae bacterium]
MLKLIRLDERLIHGQIAIKWSRHTGVDRIIVANDAAAENSVIQKSLMMAAPATCKTAIISVDKAIEMMKNPKAADHKILMLVNNPDDLLKILTNIEEKPETVNIGNYGRIAPKRNGENRPTYRLNLYLYDDEKETLKKVLDLGYNTIYQTTPEETAEPLAKALG